jgi:uncharacterized membrane protein
MKLGVGVMLASFGTFWGAEGAGVTWPGQDAALLVIVPVIALVTLGYIVLLRRSHAAALAEAAARPTAPVVSPSTSQEGAR